METQEVATRLVKLCREGKNLDAVDELYDDDIVSKEPKGSEAEITEGKDAVRNKSVEWDKSVKELHSMEVSDPLVADNHFSCVMRFDVTFKEHGRMAMSELCVYQVKHGKIVTEEFFYTMPG